MAVHITLATTSIFAFSTPQTSMHQNYDVLHRPYDISCKATIPRSTESSSSTIETATTPPNGSEKRNSKLRQLKDRMWVREALEDITAAEFASSLSFEDSTPESNSGGADSSSTPLFKREEKKKKKRAVDFDNVLNKLDERIEEMCVVTSEDIAAENGQKCFVLYRAVKGEEDGDDDIVMENMCYTLSDDVGMGSVVYTSEQREALLNQLIGTRERLVKRKEGRRDGLGNDDNDDKIEDIDDIRSQLQTDDIPEGEKSTNGSSSDSSKGKATFDPSLYVREDGTVDWDGALQDREALKKFGSVVWSRINGQEPADNDDEAEVPSDAHTPSKAVTAKIAETEAIREKRDQLDALVSELYEMEMEHRKLLNSAISEGQAVANVNLAAIPASLRQRIRKSSDELDNKNAQVTFQNLDYELERIFTYLEGELGNTAAKGYIPLQDRLNVAEFGLLESQLDNFHHQIELSETLDSDVLSVVADQVVDFKRRLGIDYYVTGLTWDSEAIQVWLGDIWVKTKDGFAFYVKGTQLFIDDVVFCSSLILRALQGYTLKPREVRTLR